MVRKWSYLVTPTKPINYGDCLRPAIHLFKVFKATTRFKKHNLGVTRLVRKKYSKRKHRTNWLNMVYVTRSWVYLFIRSKQFVRYYQSLGLFPILAYSTTTLFFSKQSALLHNPYGSFITSCSKSILGSFGYGRGVVIGTPLQNLPSTALMVRSVDDFGTLPDFHLGLVTHDRLSYPGDMTPVKSESYVLVYGRFGGLVWRQTLKYVGFFGRVLTYLTLFSSLK